MITGGTLLAPITSVVISLIVPSSICLSATVSARPATSSKSADILGTILINAATAD